jgi:hypothetical protein
MDYRAALEGAKGLPEIFELVKRAVSDSLGYLRAGLMLGLADLGNHPAGFVGAFYPVATNIIVMNRNPLNRIRETNPELYKPYAFHVLLHEYLHSVGYLDEGVCSRMTLEVSRRLFGSDHVVARMAEDTRVFFPNLVYPEVAWQPQDLNVELVPGFDRGSAAYFA